MRRLRNGFDSGLLSEGKHKISRHSTVVAGLLRTSPAALYNVVAVCSCLLKKQRSWINSAAVHGRVCKDTSPNRHQSHTSVCVSLFLSLTLGATNKSSETASLTVLKVLIPRCRPHPGVHGSRLPAAARGWVRLKKRRMRWMVGKLLPQLNRWWL